MEVVTCLHGFSQQGDSWEELASLLAAGYRWLTPDLRASSPDEAVDEIVRLWEREGVERSHLVGYSQGGRVALYLACTQPARLLTLTTIGAHAGLEGEARARRLEEDRALAERIEREGVEWFAGYWEERPIFSGLKRRGPDFLDRLDAGRRRNDPTQLATTLRGLGAGAVPPFWEQLEDIQASTLLLAGAQDPRYVEFARRLAALIPRSRAVVVPGAGHAVHMEQPQTTASLLSYHLSTR